VSCNETPPNRSPTGCSFQTLPQTATIRLAQAKSSIGVIAALIMLQRRQLNVRFRLKSQQPSRSSGNDVIEGICKYIQTICVRSMQGTGNAERQRLNRRLQWLAAMIALSIQGGLWSDGVGWFHIWRRCFLCSRERFEMSRKMSLVTDFVVPFDVHDQ
jgi:hypothetical protein